MAQDYYKILGVDKSANAEEIKAAFRKKAHEHHPDKGGDAEKFKELNEAYQVLGHAEKRKKYDQFGSAAFSGAGAGGGWGGFSGFNQGAYNESDFSDLGDMFSGFGDIFGFGGGRGRERSSRGRDLEMSLNIDFLEAVFGTEKEITVNKINVCDQCNGAGAEPGSKVETCSVCNGRGRVYKVQRTILGAMQVEAACHNCHGEGKIFKDKCHKCQGKGTTLGPNTFKVKIPAGINSGESIRLGGYGDAGERGAGSGDLFLRIKVLNHKKFIREGYDIKTKETISIRQAILGDKIEVETVDGLMKLKIPAGTQPNTIFRLKEQGVYRLNSRGRGDQLVEVTIKIPKDLNKKEKKLLEEINF